LLAMPRLQVERPRQNQIRPHGFFASYCASLRSRTSASRQAVCLPPFDVKACCNPAHLYWGSNDDNINDHKQRGTRVVALQLLDSQVAYIKLLLANGYSHTACAEWYGVTIRTISRISQGKSHSGVRPAELRVA